MPACTTPLTSPRCRLLAAAVPPSAVCVADFDTQFVDGREELLVIRDAIASGSLRGEELTAARVAFAAGVSLVRGIVRGQGWAAVFLQGAEGAR